MKKFLMIIAGWILATSLALAQVNINTASKEELDGLKGVGPTKAQAIIDYRTKNGPFKSVDELENVKGIGPAILQKLRNEVTVTGASRPAASSKADAATTKPAVPSPAAASPAPAKPAVPAQPARPAVN